MDQIKIGKFIALCRKEKQLTQKQLAEKLLLTDRAISKWENGKSMPDSSVMLDLCEALSISVNELLCGEKIAVQNYNRIAEENLLELAKKEEQQNKKLLLYEKVIGYTSTVSFLILVFVASFLIENNLARVILLLLAFVLFFIGISFTLKIETETGYYECPHCGHKYVPRYRSVYFAPHFGTTRYLNCPKCHKRGWQKKLLK